MAFILETKTLTRRFGTLVAVHNLSLTVSYGEVFGLLGPNGAGKTTLLKMLTTLLPPSSGTAVVDGYDIVHASSEVRRRIGYVPQALSADGTLSGYENLLLSAKLYDIPRAQRDERIHGALEFMGLSEARNKLVRDYSGGMIRRLEIAQAILHRPRVLFLDEPTVGLDPIARNAVWEHVEQMRKDYGTTIVLTTHMMEEADRLCERVAIMHLGNMAALGTPMDLKSSLNGGQEATLDDVFVYYAGGELDEKGNYRETSRARRTARRLG